MFDSIRKFYFVFILVYCLFYLKISYQGCNTSQGFKFLLTIFTVFYTLYDEISIILM